jgi:hypothetical protein
VFDGDERRRLYKEAREYLALRSKRKHFVRDQKAQKEQQPAVLSAGD